MISGDFSLVFNYSLSIDCRYLKKDIFTKNN